jgi:hypothetical protein
MSTDEQCAPHYYPYGMPAAVIICTEPLAVYRNGITVSYGSIEVSVEQLPWQSQPPVDVVVN